MQDLDEGKSQIAHGETVRETANMISFMADVIGIRDDMYIGKGNAYMHEVVDAVTEGHKDGILQQKPTLVNLQCSRAIRLRRSRRPSFRVPLRHRPSDTGNGRYAAHHP